MKKKELKAALEWERARARMMAEHLAEAMDRIDELEGDTGGVAQPQIPGLEDEVLPTIDRVYLCGSVTLVRWDNGDGKSYTHAVLRGGDEYDPLFGIMACIVRKLTDNKGHAVDAAEDDLHWIADYVDSVEDIDDLWQYQQMIADMLGTLLANVDAWLPLLGKPGEL